MRFRKGEVSFDGWWLPLPRYHFLFAEAVSSHAYNCDCGGGGWCLSFLADTLSNKCMLNLCFTMPVTFCFYKFCTKYKLKNYLPYYANVALSTIDMDGQLPCRPYPANTTTMAVPFAPTAAWLWQISHPYSREREPLRKG